MPSDNKLQHIAREINCSETAFILQKGDSFQIRWFTPKTEVKLCGHATLAAAHILLEQNLLQAPQLQFDSISGTLPVKFIGNKIELNFPQASVCHTTQNNTIEQAFGINPIFIGKDDLRYFIEVSDPEQILILKPDFQLLQKTDLGRFIITAKSNDPKYDFISRYFAPGVGVPEDPVTGTAHCYLAPYWSKKLHKSLLLGFQASERPGSIECELAPNNRVLLRGKAITMSEMIPKWD